MIGYEIYYYYDKSQEWGERREDIKYRDFIIVNRLDSNE